MAAGMQGERQENGGTGQLKDSGAAWDTRPQVGGRKRAVFLEAPAPRQTMVQRAEKPVRCTAKLERRAQYRAVVSKNMQASAVNYSMGSP